MEGRAVRQRVWLERTLNISTAAIVAVAAYFLVSERVIPALRGDAAPAVQGEELEGSLEFQPLGEGSVGAGVGPIAIPGPRPALLLVFSTTCPACYANLPAWRQIVTAAADRASVLAVTLESDRAAVRAYVGEKLPGAIAVRPTEPQRFVDGLGVSVVPFTVLVDAGGTVGYMRRGVLDSLGVATAIRALGVLSDSSIQ